MKKYFILLLTLALPALLFTSCNKDSDDDEGTATPMPQTAFGKYSAKVTIYLLKDNTLVPTTDLTDNNEYEDTTVVTLSQDPNDKNGIMMTDEDNQIYRGTKVTQYTTGYSFTIAKQTMNGISYEGYKGVALDGQNFHGAYYTATGKILFTIQTSVESLLISQGSDEEEGMDMATIVQLLKNQGIEYIVLKMDLTKL